MAGGDDGCWGQEWEGRGHRVVGHHLWDCAPCEEGTAGTGRTSDRAEKLIRAVVLLAPWTCKSVPLGAKRFITPANSVQRGQPSAFYPKSGDLRVPHPPKHKSQLPNLV